MQSNSNKQAYSDLVEIDNNYWRWSPVNIVSAIQVSTALPSLRVFERHLWGVDEAKTRLVFLLCIPVSWLWTLLITPRPTVVSPGDYTPSNACTPPGDYEPSNGCNYRSSPSHWATPGDYFQMGVPPGDYNLSQACIAGDNILWVPWVYPLW